MSSGRPRTRVAIWDNARIAAAIGVVIERDFGGSVSKAAEKIEIERSLLNRLRDGAARSLSRRDVGRLRKALPREDFAEIEHAIVNRRAGEALAAFDARVRSEQEWMLSRDTPTDTEVGRAIASVVGWETQRLLEYHYLVDAIRTRFPSLVTGFDRWLLQRQHSRSRGELAYTRILGPLLNGRESGCIERRWEEMSERELSRFIKAGVEREKILLDRPPDLQRAQQNAERDPIEFIALYGQLWDPRAFTSRNTNELIRRWVARQRRSG